MKVSKFVLYTIAGAALWNMFLLWAGMMLRERWEIIHEYSRILDIIVIVVAAAVIVYVVRKHIARVRTTAETRQI